jgi:outer membrane immunogenic protein
MRILAMSALALTAVATPAFAQDQANFQGPRVEVVGGWDHASAQGEGKSGFVYGGGLGYDLQRGNTVFGIEGEATGSTTKETYRGVGEVKAGRDFYVGGRLGYTVRPDTLLYVKAGYTNARVIGETADTRIARNLDGARVGAGAEYSLGHTFAKLEYRYSNYSDDFSRHQVVAGIGYRF